ncbi:MAG TPA: FIST N-terminal domain-containing protein [Nitrospiraceae bacterium]|jgi:small ligand-binding sensory domain FIST
MPAHSLDSPSNSTFKFASALSPNPDTEAAARDVAELVRRQIGDQPIDLACIFFSTHHAGKVSIISSMLQEILRPRVSIGCSGEGVIGRTQELETSPGLTLWAACLPRIQLAPLRLSFSGVQDQIRLVNWPESGLTESTFILFADPFTTPIRDVLSLMGDRYPAGKAIGGLAGGGHDAGTNCLLLNDAVFHDGLVGVHLSGPLSVRTIISQGCRPIGERYIVTRAEQNVIYELGGKPALQRLQDIFESLESSHRRDAHLALHLGIVIDEHGNRFERGDFLVRNLVGADQQAGAIAIGDIVEEGQTVQFHLRDGESASEDLQVLLATDRTSHRTSPMGALLFSCCGRGQGLFGRPHHDSRAVHDRSGNIPLAGFFAQGEIGPVGGRNFLHGYTASVALFAEPES